MKSATKLLLLALATFVLGLDIGSLIGLCGVSLSCGMPHRLLSTRVLWLTVLAGISLLLLSAPTSGRVSGWLARCVRDFASRVIDWLHSPGSKR